MKVLRDTHALSWHFQDSSRLSAKGRSIIDDKHSVIVVSAASVWEIATKFRTGKLSQAQGLVAALPGVMDIWRFERLAISLEHDHRAGLLEGAHKDPFDRMIVAQALVEDLLVVTIDPKIAELGAEVLW